MRDKKDKQCRFIFYTLIWWYQGYQHNSDNCIHTKALPRGQPDWWWSIHDSREQQKRVQWEVKKFT